MPVGFSPAPAMSTVPSPDDHHDTPNAPWFLEFCRFLPGVDAPIGAHEISVTQGVAPLGEGITIVHTDTGYTPSPVLTHGDLDPASNPIRTDAAWTYTVPFPSLQSAALEAFSSSAPQHPAVASSATVTNPNQVAAGATRTYFYSANGIDLLDDRSPGMHPSHGTATASMFISPRGAPPTPSATPSGPVTMPAGSQTIVGAAPKARVLPVRITDSVVIDPIVANNLAHGILRAVHLAKSDPSIGVISISMGWPGGHAFQNYTHLARALRDAASAGIIPCVAAGQLFPLVSPFLHACADAADSILGGASPTPTFQDLAANLHQMAQASSHFNGITFHLATYQSLSDLAGDVVEQAASLGQSERQINRLLRLLEQWVTRSSDGLRALAGPTYPGTSPYSICCAACDVHGNEMIDGFYGPEVDISVPGARVYCARTKLNTAKTQEIYATEVSSGTSFSTAITAGACALWQAHHGRQNLLNTFGPDLMLPLFRWCLKKTAVTQTVAGHPLSWDTDLRGYGMLDAAALLQRTLPANAAALIDALHADTLISDIEKMRLRRRAGL